MSKVLNLWTNQAIIINLSIVFAIYTRLVQSELVYSPYAFQNATLY